MEIVIHGGWLLILINGGAVMDDNKILIDGNERDLGEYSRELFKDDFPVLIKGVEIEYWPEFIKSKLNKNIYDKRKSLKNNLKAINKDLKLTDDELKRLKDELLNRFSCPAPEPAINKDKDSILYIALNPAGADKAAQRDKCTGSLFLNYYTDFDEGLSDTIHKSQDKKDNKTDDEMRFTYKSFYKPILDFFTELVGVRSIAWEWCNIDSEKLIERINKYFKEYYNSPIKKEDEKCLRECQRKYKGAEYQIIERDLVYYHQTSGFKELLKKEADVTNEVKNMIDHYIQEFKNTDDTTNLSLIYISSSTACHYVRAALYDDKKSVFEGYVGLKYRGIPVVFAGSELSGQRCLDHYSKSRLAYSIVNLLKTGKTISKEECLIPKSEQE